MNLVPVLLLLPFYFDSYTNAEKLKVGIVGGGIGGTATAYYLRKLLQDDVDLTLYESNAVGGRLSTRKVGGQSYEVGGAIAIKRNRYIGQLVDELGLKHRARVSGGYSSLFDGQEAIFVESEWKVVTIARLFWRYGLGIYHLNAHVGKMLDSFDGIYEKLDDLKGYENVSSLLGAMNAEFPTMMTTSVADELVNGGISRQIVDDLVAATLRVNYGQHLKVHAFVGAVSVAGVGGELWAVDGGNYRVPVRLLEESKAKTVQKTVISIVKLPSGRIQVLTPTRSDIPPEGEIPDEFDVVIVAAPQTSDMKNRIDFQGFEGGIHFDGMYHRTVCTLLRGKLRTDQFPGIYPYTDEILTTKPGLLFNSIGRVYPVDSTQINSSSVWKIFSQRPLTEEELSKYFDSPTDVSVVDWLAYPEYNTNQRYDKFLLAPGLYHLNAVEWAASAMEMSLIAAKNIANLVRGSWCSGRECPEVAKPVRNSQDEL